MEQESISNSRIAIIGAGPAGCICAKVLSDAKLDVSLFDKGKFLRTILPTGGGKCNLAHAQYDYKELAKNYPRGEKFLYSIFSKFGTSETLELFKSIGVETYTREDNRIFPKSNSSADVRDKILKSIKHTNFINEEITDIEKLTPGYKIITNKCSYAFDIVVVAIGGHSNTNILNHINPDIIPQTQALVGLRTEQEYSQLAGVSLKAVKYKNMTGDIIFTHKGISGPLIYTISSLKAREKIPYELNFELIGDIDLQELLNKNSHKEIKNMLSTLIPKSFAIRLLEELNIDKNTLCHKINGITRNEIYKKLKNYQIKITGKFPAGEVVTCGGISLKEVNPKTLEAKKHPNLYFCGEILDIDGLCGGFNLQNCWSTGYIVAKSIIAQLTI